MLDTVCGDILFKIMDNLSITDMFNLMHTNSKLYKLLSKNINNEIDKFLELDNVYNKYDKKFIYHSLSKFNSIKNYQLLMRLNIYFNDINYIKIFDIEYTKKINIKYLYDVLELCILYKKDIYYKYIYKLPLLENVGRNCTLLERFIINRDTYNFKKLLDLFDYNDKIISINQILAYTIIYDEYEYFTYILNKNKEYFSDIYIIRYIDMCTMRNNDFRILEKLYNEKILSCYILYICAKNDKYELFIQLLELYTDIHNSTILKIIELCDIKYIKILNEYGKIHINNDIYCAICKCCNTEVFTYIYSHYDIDNLNIDICKYMIKYNNIDCLKILVDNGKRLDRDSCTLAMKHKSDDCFYFAHSNGCKIYVSALQIAAQNGNLSVLQYAYLHNVRFSPTILNYAIKNDSIDCLKFLIQKFDSPIDANIYTCCIQNKAYECLKYICSQSKDHIKDGCYYIYAYEAHNLKMLNILYENGFVIPANLIISIDLDTYKEEEKIKCDNFMISRGTKFNIDSIIKKPHLYNNDDCYNTAKYSI